MKPFTPQAWKYAWRINTAHPPLYSRFVFVLFLFAYLIPSFAETSITRQQQLLHLLKQDCGSCHGMTLNGGLGSALLPEILREKPDEMLIITILEGRPGTPMPPWKSLLSYDDAAFMVEQLRKGVK
jgi:cytochrome c55X